MHICSGFRYERFLLVYISRRAVDLGYTEGYRNRSVTQVVGLGDYHAPYRAVSRKGLGVRSLCGNVCYVAATGGVHSTGINISQYFFTNN